MIQTTRESQKIPKHTGNTSIFLRTPPLETSVPYSEDKGVVAKPHLTQQEERCVVCVYYSGVARWIVDIPELDIVVPEIAF